LLITDIIYPWPALLTCPTLPPPLADGRRAQGSQGRHLSFIIDFSEIVSASLPRFAERGRGGGPAFLPEADCLFDC